MSLSKQLIILITAIFLVIFTGNFIIGVDNIKNYLQEESKIHAQDTATSLGLSLSPYIADANDDMLLTIVNGIFDAGYYKQIKLTDAEGNVLVEKSNPETFEVVPDWFQSLLPMETAQGMSEISTGWVIGGVIYVEPHPGYGYLKLWSQAKEGLTYSGIAFAVAMVAVLIFLRFILQPLKRIEGLANSIAQGRFEIIEKLPWTTEIKNVASAMNSMSKKIEGIISKLNRSIEEMNNKLQVDELTGLGIRQTFETDMKKMFISQGRGYVYTVRIHDLGEFAKERGNEMVDSFLKDFAQNMKEVAEKIDAENITLYRFHGSEFAMLGKEMDEKKADELAKALSETFVEIGNRFERPEVAHIGGTPFNPIGTTPQMLAGAQEAYEKAKQVGPNSYSLRDSSDLAKDMQEWKDLVFEIIDNATMDINYIGQAHRFSNNELFMEEAFTQAFDKEQQPIPIGTFVSIAEKYSRVVDLDKAVTSKVIQHIKEHAITHNITVNLALESVKNNGFRSWLYETLSQDKATASHLVFSLTAYNAAKDIDAFKSFIEFIHKVGAKIILKRFEAQFIPLDNIKNFNLDYIRLARDYTNGIAKEKSKKNFVEAMKELGDLLDIKIFAENVKSDNDFEVVKQIGLYGASR